MRLISRNGQQAYQYRISLLTYPTCSCHEAGWDDRGLHVWRAIGQWIRISFLERQQSCSTMNFEWIVPEHVRACRPVASIPERSFHWRKSIGPKKADVTKLGHLLAFSFSLFPSPTLVEL